jgi:hypothetical protein
MINYRFPLKGTEYRIKQFGESQISFYKGIMNGTFSYTDELLHASSLYLPIPSPPSISN